ncbi:hypothetical protein CspHIS471_0610010 [Cutaneotrichosporon sp. HIS471]|nr:hypothetical protein CspHIS471_0610010 [Cutaneotrichosporon sp. HIS471]
MTFETEPLLGLRYARLESETDLLERRDSSASNTSTRTWGWRDDDPAPTPAPEPVHEAVGGTTTTKKPKGFAALIKRFNDIGRDRRRYEKEWNRPPIWGTAYGYC